MTALLYDARDGHEVGVEDSYVCVSFRDLPIATQQLGSERLPPPSSFSDSFEFFSGYLCDSGEELCSTADIFSHGELLSFRRRDPPTAKAPPLEHWRSVSLGATQQRPGRLTMESSKLRRASSVPFPLMAPRLPGTSPSSRAPSARRRLLALGPVMKTATMEVWDIRCRQKHRQAPASPTASEKEGSKWWSDGKSRPWKILRALSCSGAESSPVVVRAIAGRGQRVRV